MFFPTSHFEGELSLPRIWNRLNHAPFGVQLFQFYQKNTWQARQHAKPIIQTVNPNVHVDFNTLDPSCFQVALFGIHRFPICRSLMQPWFLNSNIYNPLLTVGMHIQLTSPLVFHEMVTLQRKKLFHVISKWVKIRHAHSCTFQLLPWTQ